MALTLDPRGIIGGAATGKPFPYNSRKGCARSGRATPFPPFDDAPRDRLRGVRVSCSLRYGDTIDVSLIYAQYPRYCSCRERRCRRC